MAWVTRGDRGYQYRTVRRGGKVIRRYEASLAAEDVELLRRMEAARRSRRGMERASWDAERGRLDEAERRAVEADAAYDELATAALLAAGHHRPQRGRWRRRRPMGTKIEAKPTDPPVMGEADMRALLAGIDQAEGDEKRALRMDAYHSIQALVERAGDGDERAMPALRVVLDRRPDYFPGLGIADFAARAMAISGAGKDDVSLREVHVREIGRVRDELAGPAPTALERLLAERVALAWFDANQRDYAAVDATTREGCTLAKAEYLARQRDRSTARFLAAARSLATVRRLALPVLHLHGEVAPPPPVAEAGDRPRALAGDAN